jgi:shikimate dehydrogenase
MLPAAMISATANLTPLSSLVPAVAPDPESLTTLAIGPDCAYATERSQRAELVGAANAMKFYGARVVAENFDGVGLVRDVVHNLAVPMTGRRVLMLDAGGAARGALLPFLAERPAELVIANRDLDKACELARIGAAEGGTVAACGYADLAG